MNSILAVPELVIKIPPTVPYIDLRERLEAVCETAKELEKHGLKFDDPDDVDHEVAATLLTAYAEDPEGTSKKVTDGRMAGTPTPALVLAKNLLDVFGQVVVDDAMRIRNLVTNKLLLETENEDAKVRMRALELLGKISDVGLFTEKREITVTHQSGDELRESLRAKLAKIVGDVNPDEIEDAEIIEVSE